MLDALYLLVWRCSHILTDSTPANSVGWCRLNQSSVRLSYWSGDDGNYVTFIVGWCWTHMLVNTKLKHRLSPSSSNSGALSREARSGAPWVTKCGKLPIRENLVITWPYTDRPSVRTTGIPTFTLTLSSYFNLGAQEKVDCTSMLTSIDSC